MKYKALLHVTVEVPVEAEELVAVLLEDAFSTSAVSYHDLEANRHFVSVYVPAARRNRTQLRRELTQRLRGVPRAAASGWRPKISIRQLKPTDWAESWRRHFKPIEIRDHLLIKPSWSRRRPRGAAKLVVLDPGLSFGTGQHPTTRFCLEQLVAARVAGTRQSLLDIGTGTGILAIAAAKLGYQPVEAFDFDPTAVRIARENAHLNQVARARAKQMDLTRLPIRSARKFNVVCANLTHDLLIGERKRIINRLATGGCLLLAGILTTQFEAVEAVYRERGFRCTARRTEAEWSSGVFRFDDAVQRS